MEKPNLLSDDSTKSAAHMMDELSRLYYLSRAIHVVAQLGIADQIEKQPISVGEISERTGTHTQSLGRLLKFLSSYGVFKEAELDTYIGTELSAVLREDHPNSLKPNLRRIQDDWWGAVGQLEHSILTGQPAYDHANGVSRFEYLKAHPNLQRLFDEGMAKVSEADDLTIADGYDFGNFQRIVDVGGGRGGLLAQILLRAPDAEGILFDQPQVVAGSTIFEELGLANRCQLMGGDFFESVPEGGDCYVIKGVLHDFDDAQCVNILVNCSRALAPEGKLVIANKDLPSTVSRPHMNFLLDIHMMTIHPGRERIPAEWDRLFDQAGLEVLSNCSTDVGFEIIEGRRR